jgi:L-aspartate oxidase
MGCLAPRDIVARAIDEELKRTGDECVYLDVTHIEPEKVKKRFPNIYRKCLSVHIDITKDWIPVVPAAHYSCGGVATDINARTSLARLYACGEVSCTGVHGANRLASNSLLEALVYAHRAAEDSRSFLKTRPEFEPSDFSLVSHTRYVSPSETAELVGRIQRSMWKYVGIVRTNERLHKADDEIGEIAHLVNRMYESGKLRADLLELRNLATTAGLIIRSAQARKESRGLHYNLDYADRDDVNCGHDTVIRHGA